jgi:hypothetical protein
VKLSVLRDKMLKTVFYGISLGRLRFLVVKSFLSIETKELCYFNSLVEKEEIILGRR